MLSSAHLRHTASYCSVEEFLSSYDLTSPVLRNFILCRVSLENNILRGFPEWSDATTWEWLQGVPILERDHYARCNGMPLFLSACLN